MATAEEFGLTREAASVLSFREPPGVDARGALLVIPGRGEQPGVYERWGRRLAADAYRVYIVADPTAEPDLVRRQIASQLASSDAPGPRVLVGSDSGASFAAGLVAYGRLDGVDGLILAGLPVDGDARAPEPWDGELDVRTACPVHRARISRDALVRVNALYEAIPEEWVKRAMLGIIGQPILGIHGQDDAISPLSAVREQYAAAPLAELVSIVGARHDVLNDQPHRTVAAITVVWLERLRNGLELRPIAISEPLLAEGASTSR